MGHPICTPAERIRKLCPLCRKVVSRIAAGAGSAYREQSGVRPRYKVPKNKIFKWLSRESDPESGEGLEGPGGTRGASRRRGRRRRIRLLVAQRESHFTEWGYARLTFRKERA